MKNYFKKCLLFILFLTHSLGSLANIKSPLNGSYVNGIIQIISDKGTSAEIEYNGKNGWQVIGRSGSSFDTRSLGIGSYSIRDCYSKVTNDAVCVGNRVWVPKVVSVNNPVWISNPVEVCKDKLVTVWVDVIGQCYEYEDGICIDYENNGYWDTQYVPSCSYVDQGYWRDNGSSEDQGYWDTQRTCSNDDKAKRTCDPYINININNMNVGNKPANSLAVTCHNKSKTNSAGKVESVKCTTSTQGVVSNINWLARIGTTGDFAPLNSCSLNSDRTIVECANVPAGTYQVKAVGESNTGKIESPVTTIQATTISISCTPKNAKAGQKGADITCTAGAQGTPIDGAVVASGFWTASYLDAKTKQVVTVPKFCENLNICKIPSVPAGTYDVQVLAIDKYGNEITSNLEKITVVP